MGNSDPDQEFDDLLEGLVSLGCGVNKMDGTTFVSLPDDFAEFIIDRLGDWFYLGTTFMAPEEMVSTEHSGALDRFLLELQDRNLGCHFSDRWH